MNTIEIMTTKHGPGRPGSAGEPGAVRGVVARGARRLRRIAMAVAAVAALAMLFGSGGDAHAAAEARAAGKPQKKRDEHVNMYKPIIMDPGFSARKVKAWREAGFIQFDWTTDGCSGGMREFAPKFFAKFFWPCAQHDFGYRNNDLVGFHDDKTREFVDRELHERMRAVCAKQRIGKRSCYLQAKLAYDALRKFGGKAWAGDTKDPWKK